MFSKINQGLYAVKIILNDNLVKGSKINYYTLRRNSILQMLSSHNFSQ